MSFKKLYAIAALTLLGATGVASADCVAHIYNDSNQPWTFDFSTSVGSIMVGYCTGGAPGTGHCTVAPHTGDTALNITTNAFGDIEGSVAIRDSRGGYRSFTISAAVGSYPYTCDYIDHSGRTGAVSMNDPSDGDLHATGDFWDGSKSKNKAK